MTLAVVLFGFFNSAYACSDEPSVLVLGRDSTGAFFKYDLSGMLDDFEYISGNWKFQAHELIDYVPVLEEHVALSGVVKCGTVCRNSYGETVGLSPFYYAYQEGN